MLADVGKAALTMHHHTRNLALLSVALLAFSSAPRAQERPSLEVVRSYFAVCDRDTNGWVSFREARDSLEFDRVVYARLDADRDGRVDFEEFRKHYSQVSARVGALPPPRMIRDEPRDLPRQPSQILAAYDKDNSTALDEEELSAVLFDYGRAQLSITTALEKLDQDGDERLRGSELELLSRLLSTLHVVGPDNVDLNAEPATIEELFGTVIQRGTRVDAAPQPPQIVGPVTHFRRLDLDGDGGIELRDLEELVRPHSSPISLAALLAALDSNEDGMLDREELSDSLGRRR